MVPLLMSKRYVVVLRIRINISKIYRHRRYVQQVGRYATAVRGAINRELRFRCWFLKLSLISTLSLIGWSLCYSCARYWYLKCLMTLAVCLTDASWCSDLGSSFDYRKPNDLLTSALCPTGVSLCYYWGSAFRYGYLNEVLTSVLWIIGSSWCYQ